MIGKLTRILLATLCACFGALSFAQAEPILLTPGQSARDIDVAFSYVLDDGRSLKEVLAAFERGESAPDLAAASRQAESPYQRVWAMARLVNTASPEPAQAGARVLDAWTLVSETYGLLGVEAYVIHADGAADYVLSHAYDEPFDVSEHSLDRIRSEALRLARGEEAILLARFRFGPVRDARMSLETETDLRGREFASGFALTAFYAFTIAMLVFFLGFHLSLGNAIGVAYAGVFTLGLAFIAYIDGFAFRFVYPERPDWHFAIGVALMNAFSAAGLLAAGQSLRTPDAPLPHEGRALSRLAWAPAIIIVAAAVAPQEFIAQASYFLVFAMFAAEAYVALRWRRDAGGPRRVERLVSILAATSVLAMLLMLATGVGFRIISPPWLIKALYAVVGLLSLLGLTVALVDLRRRHQRAIDDRLDALAAEAERAKAQLKAEKRYSRARDLAELRQRQLATASHDIKQPLASLRMSLAAAAGRFAPDEARRLGQALDYLEKLSDSYLAEARPASEPLAEAGPDATEPYPLSLLFGALGQMFAEEAVSKGLALRVAPCTAETRADPLALMRILSNLLSNAVKHTESGRILLGARRRSNHIDICIIDTGPGMTAEELEELSGAYRKGAASGGEGLGLSICRDLARRERLTLTARSTPGTGAWFQLTIPRARQHSG